MPFTKEERAKQKADRFRAEVAEGADDTGGETMQGAEEADSEHLRQCCVPFGCTIGKLVNTADPDDVEKVVCNNAECEHGEFMHRACFLAWEDEVLTYLRSSGRARSWSEKQRRQNLWTKKGYDLAWKACSCQCAKGHLRKDLDWIPPKRTAADPEDSAQRKQRRRKRSSDKPSIGKATSLPASQHCLGRHRHTSASSNENHTPPHSPVVRSDSFSSPSQSPRGGNGSNPSHHTGHASHQGGHGGSHSGRNKHHSGGSSKHHESFDWPTPRHHGNRESGDGAASRQERAGNDHAHPQAAAGAMLQSHAQQHLPHRDRVDHSNHKTEPEMNGCSPKFPPSSKDLHKPEFTNHRLSHELPFLHRMDLSVFFKVLPPQKCNPYHIRMDGGGEQGSPDSDEIRGFIFGALASHGMTAMICSLCQNGLPVFDCYPLIDGTFYLTPLNHSDANLRLILNGRVQYLGAVCMQCLEGGQTICRICNSRWDGSRHQLGTLYSYDIFAASPCCPGRVSCKKCGKQVIDPTQGTHFFSDYSQNIQCPHCGVPDFHFVKPLSSYEVLRQEINTC